MASVLVPPGGFKGFAQMTSASQNILSRGVRGARAATGIRRRKKSKASAPAKRRRANGTKKKARLVKGSAAAKAYMAKIRRKRK